MWSEGQSQGRGSQRRGLTHSTTRGQCRSCMRQVASASVSAAAASGSSSTIEMGTG